MAEEDEEEEDDDEQEAGNAAASAPAPAAKPKPEKASLFHAALERAATTLGHTQLKALVEGAVPGARRASRSATNRR